MNRHRILVSSCVSFMLLASGNARAQEENQPKVIKSSDSLETVIVTVQRRAQNLQDVPITANAVSAVSLERANITTAVDINKLVPDVFLAPSNGTVLSFMRGYGNNQAGLGNEAAIPVYIDGVYINRLSQSELRLNNIERIEVLKGPQGTLFGRNAEAGAIQIVTRDPDPNTPLILRGSLGYGSFNTLQANAYASVALSPRAAVDFAGTIYDQQKGFGVNRFDGAQAKRERSWAFRSKFLLQLTDDTKIVIAGDIARTLSDQGQTSGHIGSSGYFDFTSGLIPRFGYYDTYEDVHSISKSLNGGGSVRIEHDTSIGKIASITAYRYLRENNIQDADLTPEYAFNSLLPDTSAQFSQELRLSSNPDSRVEWTAGLYYLTIKDKYYNARLTGFAVLGDSNKYLEYDTSQLTHSYAAYGQATIPLISSIELILGARYTRDDLKAQAHSNIVTVGGPTVSTGPVTRGAHNFEKLTYKVGLDYKPVENVLAYFTYSRGYKAGLYNLLFDLAPVRPETMDNYEAGAKFELFDRRFRLNLAAFHYTVANPQVAIVPHILAATTLVNAGGIEANGGEFGGEALVTPNLTLSFGATFVYSEYTSYPNAPIFTKNNMGPIYGLYPPVAGSAAGNRPPRAPKFSSNIGFQYNIPVGTSTLVFSSNYAYTGAFYWTPDNIIGQKAFGLLDATLTYNVDNGPVTLRLWGSNLINEKYSDTVIEIPGPPGFIQATGNPRQFGVAVDVEF